ncbi:MAG TPA: cytochrome b/b6 domain-containing protein, partial [Rhodanobacter sp.]|nr:cytochrome b/b6 domain-containing protein [Rhodanobacter sp.]
MTRVQRHGWRARCLHGANAVVLLVLLATGLALGDWLPGGWVAAVGGHDAVDAVHRLLGLAFVGVAVLLSIVLWRGTAWLVRELTRFRAGDGRWPLAYFRHALAPGRRAAPFHAGWFDPLERLVLTVLLAATVVAGVSGVYLYWLPAAPAWVFLVAIRAHVYVAWLLIAMLAVHV